VTCALPYHSTPDFVKLVQLANLEGTSFYFLKHVKERGAAPPRDQLVARCVNDPAFLSFVCDAAAASASAKVRPVPTPIFPSPVSTLASAISDEISQSRARISGFRDLVSSGLVWSCLASRLSARSRRSTAFSSV
jgi:U3 small nucleolar RNA-associated protein 10